MAHIPDSAMPPTVANLQSQLPFHLRIAFAYRLGLLQSKRASPQIWTNKLDLISVLAFGAAVLFGAKFGESTTLLAATLAISIAAIAGAQYMKRRLSKWFTCISETGEAPELLAYACSAKSTETYLSLLGRKESTLVHCDLLISKALARQEWRELRADSVANDRAICSLMDVGFEQFHSYNVAKLPATNTNACHRTDHWL